MASDAAESSSHSAPLTSLSSYRRFNFCFKVKVFRGPARKILVKSPDASQETIAWEIHDKWRLADVKPPSHDILLGFIREMRKLGDLPPKKGAKPLQPV
jgi:hypothetical protein